MDNILPPNGSSADSFQLPILIVNAHSNCNCRCIMCDIWQSKTHTSLRLTELERHRESLRQLGVRHVVFTGGEPLLNLDLPLLADFLHALGIRVTLLSTGLLLKKRATEIAAHIDDIIVSIDGPPPIHDAIRRVPGAFTRIEEGIRAVRLLSPRLPIAARCTVQKANHRHLSETATAALQLGFDSLSFLAADVSSEAFNRPLLWPIARQDSIALTSDEVDALDGELDRLIAAHGAQFESGFLQESPVKLRGIVRTFRVHLGQLPARAPLCNAPWVAAVLEPNGDVRPCFFHPPYGNTQHATLQSVVAGAAARRLRDSLDVSAHPTCKRCVCSLNYRGDVSSGPSHQSGADGLRSSTFTAGK